MLIVAGRVNVGAVSITLVIARVKSCETVSVPSETEIVSE